MKLSTFENALELDFIFHIIICCHNMKNNKYIYTLIYTTIFMAPRGGPSTKCLAIRTGSEIGFRIIKQTKTHTDLLGRGFLNMQL